VKALRIDSDTAQARIIDIDSTDTRTELRAMQTEIGGYLETLRLSRDTVMLCDEMGVLKRLPQNPLASLIAHRIILGTVLLVGIEQGDDEDRLTDCPERYRALLE
jgi:hypothetical protein